MQNKTIMKNLILLPAIMLCVLFIACDKDNDPQPIPEECDKNNWSYVYFENRSNSNKSMDVYWDGSCIIQDLDPGEKSEKFIFSASQHQYTFKVKNTNNEACNSAYPSLAKCTTSTFYCTY